MMSLEKHAATITPAAPVGELNPARSALVSRNTLNLFCIGSLPDLISACLHGATYGVFWIQGNSPFLFRQIEIRPNLHLLDLSFESNEFLEYGARLIHADIVVHSGHTVNPIVKNTHPLKPPRTRRARSKRGQRIAWGINQWTVIVTVPKIDSGHEPPHLPPDCLSVAVYVPFCV